MTYDILQLVEWEPDCILEKSILILESHSDIRGRAMSTQDYKKKSNVKEKIKVKKRVCVVCMRGA